MFRAAVYVQHMSRWRKKKVKRHLQDTGSFWTNKSGVGTGEPVEEEEHEHDCSAEEAPVLLYIRISEKKQTEGRNNNDNNKDGDNNEDGDSEKNGSEKDDNNKDGDGETGVVYFKNDGNRFSQQYSIRLKSCCLYNVAVGFREDFSLTSVCLGGKHYNNFTTRREPSTHGITWHQFVWSTENIKVTQRNYRSILPVEVKLRSLEELRFNVCVKFYEDEVEERRLSTGFPLTRITVECVVACEREKGTTLRKITFG